jgi:2-polyprenyl-3-methyl-5-hydroxy-6-metoxy-1,4-benzoquinol methylase
MTDLSNGYEALAALYIRERRNLGAAVVRKWARDFPPGASVLDLGCGHGVPISQALIRAGFAVYAIDASPTLFAAFHKRFPHTPVECAPAAYRERPCSRPHRQCPDPYRI